MTSQVSTALGIAGGIVLAHATLGVARGAWAWLIRREARSLKDDIEEAVRLTWRRDLLKEHIDAHIKAHVELDDEATK